MKTFIWIREGEERKKGKGEERQKRKKKASQVVPELRGLDCPVGVKMGSSAQALVSRVRRNRPHPSALERNFY